MPVTGHSGLEPQSARDEPAGRVQCSLPQFFRLHNLVYEAPHIALFSLDGLSGGNHL